jgi:hypothetical protein
MGRRQGTNIPAQASVPTVDISGRPEFGVMRERYCRDNP